MSPIPDIPPSVQDEIQQALGSRITALDPQRSGTHGQTYLMNTTDGHWIVRVRERSPDRLKRSLVAQRKAGAAGMLVPMVAAAHVDAPDPDDYTWIVEEYVHGALFFPEQMDRETRLLTSADIGRQLKLLHAVELSDFGPIPTNGSEAPQATWTEWVDEQEADVDAAVTIARVGPAGRARVREAYRLLRATSIDRPRLCHGDFADDNLLVGGGSLVAVIDWESAIGCDPAHDVAYWFMWHRDAECLDALLSAYQPSEPTSFRRRIRAHLALLGVRLIAWYEERGDAANVDYCRRILQETANDRAPD